MTDARNLPRVTLPFTGDEVIKVNQNGTPVAVTLRTYAKSKGGKTTSPPVATSPPATPTTGTTTPPKTTTPPPVATPPGTATPPPATTPTTTTPVTANSSRVARNASSTPVAVTSLPILYQPSPAISASAGSESLNGATITGTSGSLTTADGSVLTLRDGGSVGGQARGLTVFCNGKDVNMSEGNSGHGLRFIEKLKWWNHRLAIYSEGDWFLKYGAPWTSGDCYLLGEDIETIFTYVQPSTPPNGPQPYPVGARVGNADGGRYYSDTDLVQAYLGKVQYINVFNQFNTEWNNMANEAGGIVNIVMNNPVAKKMIPVIGLKMARNYYNYDNNQGGPDGHDCCIEYRNIIAGNYDSYIIAIADKWHQAYTGAVYWRFAYEFNGQFMPDYIGHYDDDVTWRLWVQAHQRCVNLVRQSAAKYPAVRAYMVWNPNCNTYSGRHVTDVYPGDTYIDVVGIDAYSPVYENDSGSALPGSSTLWNGDNTYSNNIKEWLTKENNRVRWWDFGTGDYYAFDGSANASNKLADQFGFQMALNFAKTHNKPIMMCETGAGNREQWRNTGPCDEPLFPLWLRSRLDQATNMGIPVIAAMLWVKNESDGGWGAIEYERRKEQQAWSAAFGGSTPATIIEPGGGLNPAVGGTGAAPTTPTTTPPPQTTVVESADKTKITTAGPAIYDAAKNKFTLGPAVAPQTGLGVFYNGAYQSPTSDVVEGDYVGHAFYQKNGSGNWYKWNGPTTGYTDATDPNAVTTPPASGTSSTPTTATGDINVNFASKTGQHIYGTIYGFGSGALVDNKFARTGNSSIQPAIKKLTPRLFRLNCNANINGTAWQDWVFRNGVASPDWTGFDPLFDNAAGWFAPNTEIMLGIGNGSGTLSASTMAAYAKALANRAIAKGQPIKLWEVENERDGVSRTTYNGWFTAVADALHAIDPSYKVFGPVNSYATSTAPDGAIQSLCQAAGSKVGGICYHTYLNDSATASGWSDDTLYANTLMLTEARVARQSADSVTATVGVPVCIGEWNIIFEPDTNYKQQINNTGAIYSAIALYRVIDANINARYGAIWEMYGDSTYGQVNDPNNGFYSDYRVFPAGQFLAYAGQHMDGDRVTVTVNKTGKLAVLAVTDGTNYAVQIINYDTATAFNGFKPALKGPVSISNNVTMHQISPATANAAVSTITYASLMSAGINLPAASVTHLVGTLSMTNTATPPATPPTTPPAATTPTTTPPPATARFQASAGKWKTPAGADFKAKGINVTPYTGYAPSLYPAVKSLFPGINTIRAVTGAGWTQGGQDQPTYETFLNAATAEKVVCIVDNHSLATVHSGQALTDICNWYAALATKYKNNPYVWFDTSNEPDGDFALLAAEELAIYNAIRNTGNMNPVLMQLQGGSYTDWRSGRASTWSGMTNVGWDLHFYGFWESHYGSGATRPTTNAATASNLASAISITQQFVSADGIMPVIIGEFGPSTSGAANSVDTNAAATLAAVFGNGVGWIGWALTGTATPGGDSMSDNGTSLTSWGQQIAANVAGTPSAVTSTPPPVAITALPAGARYARDVRNGWGVNAPFDVPSAAASANALAYLGTRWVRQQFSGDNSPAMTGLQDALVSAGAPDPNLKLQLLLNGYIANGNTNTLTNQKNWILNSLVPKKGPNGKSILWSIEGPNEMNNPYVGQGSRGPNDQVDKTGQGPSGPAGTAANPTADANFVDWATQVANFKSANATALAGVEIISPTVIYFMGQNFPSDLNVSSLVDYGTFHYYAGVTGTTGVPSYPPNPGNFNKTYGYAQAGISPGKPMVMSEGGASTENGSGGYSQRAAARYHLMALLDFFAVGGKRTMIYNLFNNANSTPSNTTSYNEDNFGLFYPDGTPKQGAIALRNFQDLVSLGLDRNAAANFTDTTAFNAKYDGSTLTVTGLTNAGTSGSKLVMPKSDGSTIIAVWNEPPIDTGGASTSPTANPVTVNFGSTQTYKVYDPTGGGGVADFTAQVGKTPIASGTGASVNVTLYGTPVLIELSA